MEWRKKVRLLIRRALLSTEINLDEVKGSFRPILLFHFHLPVPEYRLENQDVSDGENLFDEFPEVLRGYLPWFTHWRKARGGERKKVLAF